MRNKMFILLGIIVVLFAALYFTVEYKNKQAIEKSGNQYSGEDRAVNAKNPYDKKRLEQATIDQLDDPLYQNQIIPSELDKKLEKEENVAVYFYQPTCPGCQRTTPVIVPMAKKMGVDLKKVNLLEFRDKSYWDRYFVTMTPTVVLYKNGVEEARIESADHKEDEFKAFFEKYKSFSSK